MDIDEGLLQKLTAKENWYLRQMMRLEKGEEEAVGAWRARAARAAHAARAKAGERGLAQRALAAYHNWMGHVMRRSVDEPDNPATIVWRFRGLQWWRVVQALQSGENSDLLRQGEQRDVASRTLHTTSRTWAEYLETRLEDYYKDLDWDKKALDRETWKKDGYDFVAHFIKKWRLPTGP